MSNSKKTATTPIGVMVTGLSFLLYGLLLASPSSMGNLPLVGKFHMFSLWIWIGMILMAGGLVLQAILLVSRAKAPAAPAATAAPAKKPRVTT